MEEKVLFNGIKDGETFEVAGMTFIKFPDADGKTPVVMRGIAFNSRYGKCNDLRKSPIMDRLQSEILPKIVEAIGEENVCTFETDLTCLDGLSPYGTMTSRISLPTMDFYRRHVAIFDAHNPDVWWWLATPESAEPHYSPNFSLCVSPSGCLGNGDCYDGDYGVRPFLIFNSCIFGSEE